MIVCLSAIVSECICCSVFVLAWAHVGLCFVVYVTVCADLFEGKVGGNVSVSLCAFFFFL